MLYLGVKLPSLSKNMILFYILSGYPANTRRRPNVGLIFGQCRRRWAYFNQTLCQRLVFAG